MRGIQSKLPQLQSQSSASIALVPAAETAKAHHDRYFSIVSSQLEDIISGVVLMCTTAQTQFMELKWGAPVRYAVVAAR